MIRYFLTLVNLMLFISFVNSQTNCELKNLKVTPLPCNADKKFNVKIQFEFENQGDQGFKIQGNGKVYGTYSYDNLPIILEGLTANCETNYEFVIRDIAHNECAIDTSIGKICCEGNCELNIINPVVSDCLDDAKYKVGFDVINIGTKNLGFDFYANDDYVGFYKYNQLPLSNILLNSSSNPLETLVVCENDNQQCCDTINIASPCNCNIHNIRTQVIECSEENESYYLRINFDHNKTSDSFLIGGSSILHGTFAYNNLPVFIGPFNFGENIGELLIADKTDIFCFGSIEPKVLEGCISCGIKELSYSKTECNEEGELYVKLKFEAINPGVKGFSIRGNGISYGQDYNYGEGTYYIGPFAPNCDKEYEFVIIDNANNNCQNEIVLEESLCCEEECSIKNPVITSICDGDLRKIKVEYEGRVNSDSVYILINNVIVRKIASTENPFTVQHAFVNNTIYKLSIISATDESCRLIKEFKFTCEEESDCGFENVLYDLTECNEDDKFFIILRFTAVGQHANKFKVKVNELWYGPYEYGQNLYEIGPIQHTCDGIRIQIQDLENEECSIVKEFAQDICCDENESCNIGDYDLQTICFDGDIIGITFLVPGQEGEAFDLYINGTLIGRYKYSDIPFIVNKKLEQGFSTIKFIDVADPSCSVIFEPYLNCDKCSINKLIAKGIECTEEKAKFEVNFSHANTPTDSFYLQINDDVFGPFGYNELPIVPNKFYNPAADLTYNFKILDKEKNCGLKVVVPFIDCISSTENPSQLENKIFESTSNASGISITFYQSELTNKIFIYSIDGKILHKSISKGNERINIEFNNPYQLLLIKVDNEMGFEVKKIVK